MEQASATTAILVVIIAVLTALVLYVAARSRAAQPTDETPAVKPVTDDAVDYRALAEATRRQLVEAELRTLRSQISPHFIYNSLNAIAATIPADPVKARELVIDFADFTRYSLRGAGDFTTLEEELAAVERYVLLEQARFEDRVQVRLKIAPEILSLKLPFLAVQPLVENAVRHGMDSATGQAKVRLTGQDEGTHAVISVEDDGPGADPEQIRRVLVGEEGSSHIGLRNVDLRLRQAYGGADGLQIETAEGAGMRVWMRVPKFQPGTEESA
ncbi:histidine kinase [Nesterenkonia populi]|uniref:histidine kinase n=1 Tax=Nesterenkonia populi TaxID=1591087 RepID=UPI0011BF6BEF